MRIDAPGADFSELTQGFVKNAQLPWALVTQPEWSARMSKFYAFLRDESGATAIEYGLIVAGIAVVIITTVNTIGSTLNAGFQYIKDQLN
jgi:pilus assembly protein Flp/PilA